MASTNTNQLKNRNKQDIMTVSQCARKLGRTYGYVDYLICAGLLHVTGMSKEGFKCVSFSEARDAQAQHENTPEGYIRRTEAARKLGISIHSLLTYAMRHGIRRKKAYEQHHIAYVFNANDVNLIASGQAKNLKHAKADMSADELREKRAHDLKIMRMREYAIREYTDREKRDRLRQQKNDAVFLLRVQAQKDAIREGVKAFHAAREVA